MTLAKSLIAFLPTNYALIEVYVLLGEKLNAIQQRIRYN